MRKAFQADATAECVWHLRNESRSVWPKYNEITGKEEEEEIMGFIRRIMILHQR